MADAISAGYARSEQLKREWTALKRSMHAVDPNHPEAAQQRNEIHARMDHVMSEMADVLTETRRLVPNASDQHDDCPISAPTPPHHQHVQYSARKLHIIQRTYDSSSQSSSSSVSPSRSSSDSDSVYEPSQVDKLAAEDPEDYDLRSLRQDMMNHASTNDVITVESKGLRANLNTFKDKLLKPQIAKQKSKDKPQVALPLESPRGKPLSTDDREDLALEQSRLERESRRLKRKPERNYHDKSRLEAIANRLSRISSTLADEADTHGEGTASFSPLGNHLVSQNGKKNSFSSKPPRLERSNKLPTIGEHDEELGIDEAEIESASLAAPATATGAGTATGTAKTDAKGTAPKRKKGWMALEAGVASLRALGRNVRQGAGNSKDGKSTFQAIGSRGKSGNARSSTAHVHASPFTETAQRLDERGERLNSTAEGAEHMANDAGDMLAAVRALRQRNQKTGFFA